MRRPPAKAGKDDAAWRDALVDWLDSPELEGELKLSTGRDAARRTFAFERVRAGEVIMVRIESVLPDARELSENAVGDLPDDPALRAAVLRRLIQAESQLDSLTRRWPGVIFQQKADFSFEFVSPQLAEITGIEPRRFRNDPKLFWELLHEADLPPGVVNLVNGRGPVTGQALVSHPGVDVIGFIGGTATGSAIMGSAAATIKKVGLELGGKSANIVLASADFDQALDGSLLAILTGSGQQCLAGSRVLIERPIADEFIEQFTARMRNIRIGDPFDPATELGPMAFAAHRDKVLSYAGIAQAEGAKLLCGGRAAEGFGDGYFIEPTAVLASSNQSRVCQEEIFGPFASLLVVDGIDEAVRIANESQYGLVSYLWSRDLPTVMDAARRIQAGTVWVNTPLARDLRAPFGGYKQSGLGRDGLQSSVELMTEEKTMMVPTGSLQLPKLGLS